MARKGRSRTSFVGTLLICLAVDILDFTLGRIFGLGIVADIVQTIVAVVLFGPVGLFALWELADPSEQLDGFVPTLTILALTQMGRRRPRRPRTVS